MTDAELVRLLISDVSPGEKQIFSDDEINGFLELGGNVRQAAAEALRTIASNEAQVMKRIEYLNLKTDGEAVADVLRKLADTLEEKAKEEEAVEADIEFAEMNVDPATQHEMVLRHFGVYQ